MEDNRNEVLKIVGQNIKNIRKSKGITQEQLAEDLNKSINMISLLENGSSGASEPTIVDICNNLKVDANSIFKGLLTYNIDEKDKYIIDNIATLSSEDKEIVINLIQYIINRNSKVGKFPNKIKDFLLKGNIKQFYVSSYYLSSSL